MKQNRSSAGTISSLYHKYYLQKGRGSSGKFGQIYQGQRFPGHPYQTGSGFASFLGTLVRGIGNLIGRTPGWVKSGAKIAGASALKGVADYAGDVDAGVPKEVARKRAFKSAVADMMESGGKKIRGAGRRRKTVKNKAGAGCRKKSKSKTCKLKLLTRQQGGRPRRKRTPRRQRRRIDGKKKRRVAPTGGIKRRSKFDLFSV
jgi:hypothetical protein